MNSVYSLHTYQDLIVAPIYLVLIIVIALLLRKTYTKGQPHIKKYFMPALFCRIVGALASYLMYAFYSGGDTMGYYLYAKVLLDTLISNPVFAWELWFTSPDNYPDYINVFFSGKSVFYIARGADMTTVGKIGSILIFFTGKSYLATSFILGFFSFLGCWKLFEVFNSEYPHLHKSIALATLFVPSVFFWGSAGLMKDTIIIIALGYIVWGTYFLFIRSKNRIAAILSIVLGTYFIVKIKLYVAIVLFPSLFIWVVLRRFSTIRNKIVKRVFFPIMLITGLLVTSSLFFMLTNISGNKYRADKLLYTAQQTQWWHKVVSENGGSSYDLGEWEPTFLGLLPMIPKSINVTLFRPYFWEAKKVILLPGAIEGFISLLITIYIIFITGIFRIIKKVFTDSTLFFCVTFSLFFAFAVGFTSYNFGALARYKIPCLPFYFTALAILYGYRKRRFKEITPLSTP